TKDISKDTPKLNNECIKDSVTEISGENKNDSTTKNKNITDENNKSEIQTPGLDSTSPIILSPKTQESEPFTTEEIRDSTFIKIIDKDMLTPLKSFLNSDELYNSNPKISAHELFMILPQLKTCDERNDESLKKLINWLEKEFDSTLKQIENMLNKVNVVKIFYAQVYSQLHGKIFGARITRREYKTSSCTQFFAITGEVIETNGHEFVNSTKNWYIDHYVGMLNIDKLPVIPLPKESAIYNELVKRGKKFEMLAIGSHYLRYTGKFFRQSWFGATFYRGDGRMMIDASTFGQINPNYDMGYNTTNYDFNPLNYERTYNINNSRKIKEEELSICSPTFFGFSFMAKKWGQFFVDQVDDIKFDDDAFDNLIMDIDRKDIITSLVKSEHSGGLDLISGKGGGCIFLLHGPPGAISEYLHRPLYAVSVGELGVTPKELEDKLSEILEVASVWNAVILIDEVDIFLEQRSKNDIKRNALVGIFLRLLEYHQGILFFTTNLESFDKAFHSRISVILKYDELDELARAQVWRTFLDRADGKNKNQVDIDKLKLRNLNGREIKTAVRMAKALATKSDSNAIIITPHLEKILDISVKNI
ncbi:5120_t:CDS:10, partial [Gigaspora margarita]